MMHFPALSVFEQRIESTEAEAEAHTEISGEMESIEKEVRQMDRNTQVEDELAALKQKLNKDKTQK